MFGIATPDLAARIEELTRENVYLCYQCRKCTSGCPVAPFFDLAPHQIVRALQLGQKDLILHSRTIWLCTQCQACATRCPHAIDIPAIMDELRIMAQHEGVRPEVRSVPLFHEAALRSIHLFGRMYEAGLMGELYLRLTLAGELDLKQLVTKDLPMAARMVRDGKLRILPSLARYPNGEMEPTGRVSDPRRMAYYPGCSLHGTSREYDLSVRAAMKKLDIELEEPEGWVCCGTTSAHSTDQVLSTILPLRNVSLIERSGHSYVTAPCPLCFTRLRAAIEDARRDPELQRQVAARAPDLTVATAVDEAGSAMDVAEPSSLRKPHVPAPDVKVDHLLSTVTDRIGYERVAQAVIRPLKGLKVACYYGCVITRPPALTQVREYEYPTNMDRLVRTLGADPLDWSYKTECCGASLGITQLPIALQMTERILRNARATGAEAVVVACPFCHVNLDSRQKQIEEQISGTLGLPVLYFAQLMGLAFGVDPEGLGLAKHFVDPFPLLRQKKLA
jgi:heterodisulfide reductase subunit B